MTIYDIRLSALIMSLIHFAVTALTRPESLSAEGVIRGLGITGSLTLVGFGFVLVFGCVSYRKNRSYWNRKFVRVIESNDLTWDVSLKLSPRRV